MFESIGAYALQSATQLSADGRFRIEEALGKGGMAVVYRAYAPALGRQIALKRLSVGAGAKDVALFEREYHTLSSLKHPHVVEVLDYGTDHHGPWYAMELLEGSDLSKAAPLPWTEVCRILRDVSSALASVHARGLLHRDISARNVWRNPTGLVKLIDFGAMCAFGRTTEIVGTAPFVAPETLRGQQLDQRTDLYSLGVLGYFLLTGAYPFPARSLSELEELWLTAFAPPSERARELRRSDLARSPRELDALIDALLCHDPAGRPGSAAELIERLDAIVPPLDDRTTLVVEASLRKTAFVGHGGVLDALDDALQGLALGHGSAALIEADPGLGRSHLLDEFAVRVRLAGAAALHVDPAPHRREAWEVARAFALRLLEALPEPSRRLAAPYASVLGHLSASLRDKLGLGVEALAEMPTAAGEARVRIQAALVGWFLDVARERSIVLLADDLHTCDEPSAAWLASLAYGAKAVKLLVVGTLRLEASDELQPALRRFRRAANCHTLHPLTSRETLQLLRSIFGDAARLGRLAEAVHRSAGGAPAHAMELVKHLVERGLISYVDGAWTLPQDLDQAAIPNTRVEVLKARLARLTPEARSLAQALSVIEGRITLHAIKALYSSDTAAAFSALELLVKQEVLAEVDGDFAFLCAAARDVLADELGEQRRALTHRTLAELTLQTAALSTSDRLRVGVHLLCGGAVARGSAFACVAARDLATTHVNELAGCASTLERALSLQREHGRPLHEQTPLLAALACAGYHVDRKLAARYGSEALEALARTAGLSLTASLRPLLGRKLALFAGLFAAAIWSRCRTRAKQRVTLQDTILLLCSSVACLTGVYTICIDPVRAAACARVIEPLTALGRNYVTHLLHEYCTIIHGPAGGRPGETLARMEQMLKRLATDESIRGLPDSLRLALQAGMLAAAGAMASWRDGPDALRIAGELDALGLKLYAMNADQIRMIYFGHQGDRIRFDYYREQVELHAIERGTAWQAETWAAASQLSVYRRLHDATQVKLSIENLQRVGEEVPSLSAYARLARAIHSLLRGKPRDALPWLEDVLWEQPAVHASWAPACGVLATAYNELGEHARARALCRRAMSNLSPADLAFPTLNLKLFAELAIAEAGLGNAAEAARQIESLLERHAPGQGPVTLGSLHEAGARIATLTGDLARFEHHLACMKRAYCGTQTASLIERYERISQEYKRRLNRIRRERHFEGRAPRQSAGSRPLRAGGNSAVMLARRALMRVSKYLDVEQAYVYVANDNGMQRVAEIATGHCIGPDPEVVHEMPRVELRTLDTWVGTRVGLERIDEITKAPLRSPAPQDRYAQIELHGSAYALVPLTTSDRRGTSVVGALVVAERVAKAIPELVLSALASRLYRWATRFAGQRLAALPSTTTVRSAS